MILNKLLQFNNNNNCIVTLVFNFDRELSDLDFHEPKIFQYTLHAAGLFPSVTVVAPEATELVSSSFAQARLGNFLVRTARYFGWL